MEWIIVILNQEDRIKITQSLQQPQAITSAYGLKTTCKERTKTNKQADFLKFNLPHRLYGDFSCLKPERVPVVLFLPPSDS